MNLPAKVHALREWGAEKWRRFVWPKPSGSDALPVGVRTLSPVWLVGFAAEKSDLDPDGVRARLTPELQALDGRVRAAGGTLHFLSRLGGSADLGAMEAAHALALPLHVVLAAPPIKASELDVPFANADHRRRANRLWRAIRVQPRRCTWRMIDVPPAQPTANQEAGVKMVEGVDYLLVLGDDRTAPSAELAELVALAENRGVSVVTLKSNPITELPRCAMLPVQSDPALARLAQSGVARLERPADPASAAAKARAKSVKQLVSDLANQDARIFRSAAAAFVGCNVLAATLGAINGAIYGNALATEALQQQTLHRLFAVMMGAELLAIGVGFWFRLWPRKRHRREEWASMRFAAELSRGLLRSAVLLDPLYPVVGRDSICRPAATGGSQRLSPSDWRRFAVTLALEVRAGSDWSPRSGVGDTLLREEVLKQRDDYVKGRLGGKNGQIAHFQKKGVTPWWLTRLSKYSGLLVVLSVFAVLPIAANRFGGWNPQVPWPVTILFVVLPVVLPLLAALPSVLMSILDYDRRAMRYPDLREKLEVGQRNLSLRESPVGIQREVQRIESMLLEENIEWYFSTGRLDPN